MKPKLLAVLNSKSAALNSRFFGHVKVWFGFGTRMNHMFLHMMGTRLSTACMQSLALFPGLPCFCFGLHFAFYIIHRSIIMSGELY